LRATAVLTAQTAKFYLIGGEKPGVQKVLWKITNRISRIAVEKKKTGSLLIPLKADERNVKLYIL
jgi:hypothetical protein